MTERPDGPILSNPRSDRIRAIRALSGRSVRQRTNRFLIEGPQSVREAVRCGFADEVLFTAAAAQRYPEIMREAAAKSIWAREATADVIQAISADAQGIIAVAPMPQPALEEVLVPGAKLVVILHENQDPGNAGTVIRTADAAGADAVIMTRGSVDAFNPKVVRATAGSLFHIPVVTGIDLEAALATVSARSLQVLAADGGAGNDLDELLDALEPGRQPEANQPDLRRPTAWLFGNEARGLQALDLQRVDAAVAVPIHGGAESLNLATAAALCLYASARAQRPSAAANTRA